MKHKKEEIEIFALLNFVEKSSIFLSDSGSKIVRWPPGLK
jgi:hypothetical protein